MSERALLEVKDLKKHFPVSSTGFLWAKKIPLKAVDGVSLTVSAVDAAGCEVVLIPHTLEVTLFGRRRSGDAVNLEADVIAKYVERLLQGGADGQGVDWAQLAQHGFA
mgnify:CR=1 FL=1